MMDPLDQRIAAALRAPTFDRPLPDGLADRVAAAARAAQGRGGAPSRPASRIRHSAFGIRRAAAVLLLAAGLASAAAAAWYGVLRPGLRWGVAGGDRARDLVPGTALPCLVFAVPCAPGTPSSAIEERVLGPLGRLAERNGWRARDAAPALGTLAHGAFRDRGGVLIVPLPERADADAIRALAREKAAALAESFPAFAEAPLVDVRPFPVPSPGFASEAALSFADQILLEAAGAAGGEPPEPGKLEP